MIIASWVALNLFRSRFTNLTNSEPYLLEEHTGIEQCLGSVSCQKEEEKGERGREGGGGRRRGEGEGDGEGEREGGEGKKKGQGMKQVEKDNKNEIEWD